MNNNPIGIVDSGIGGLSVWQEIVKLLPKESIIYLADSKYLPYGEKSEAEIYTLSKRLIQFLVEQQVKLVVIACNTITVSALEDLRKDFPGLPIIGTVPVIKTAVATTKNKRIGVLSTKRTAESAYQKKLIAQFAPHCDVSNVGTNVLVPMIESDAIDTTVLKQELRPFLAAKVDTLALGCTHFPFLRKEMQEVLGKGVHILDSGEAIARQVKHVLRQEGIESESVLGSHILYTTGDEELFKEQIKRLVGAQRGRIQEVNV